MRIYFTMVFLLLAMVGGAQNYKWVKGGGSTTDMTYSRDWEAARYMCVDDNKNVYVVSLIGDDNLTADSFYMSSAFNNHSGNDPHFLVTSYKCDGSMRWAKLFDAYYRSDPSGIVYDKGSIYVVGDMQDVNKHIGYDTLINNHYVNNFIARFDTSGKFKWVKFTGPDSINTFINTGTSAGYNGVAVDGHSNIHFFQFMKSGVQLSPFVRSTTGTYDLKYDSMGNLLNAKKMPIDSTEIITKVLFDQEKNKMYAILKPNPSYPFSPGYLAAFDSTGTQLWSDTLFTGNLHDIVYDGKGTIYGVCYGTPVVLGKDTIGMDYLTDYVKIDPSGHASLLCGFNGNGSALYRLTLLNSGQLAATGELSYYLSHGIDTLKSSSGQHPILCIVDTTGKLMKFDKLISGAGYNWGLAITSDKDNNIYIGGQIQDYITVKNTYASIGGNSDYFVAKYGYECNCTIATEATPNYSYTGSGTVHFTYTGVVTPDSLHWDFGDGSTSNATNPTHGFHDTGMHRVCLTVYACDSGTYCGWVYTTTEAPSISPERRGVNLWPNPTKASLQLTVSGSQKGGVYVIIDMSGRTLLQGEVHATNTTIDVSGLVNGMYFLQFSDGEGTKQVLKFVKE